MFNEFSNSIKNIASIKNAKLPCYTLYDANNIETNAITFLSAELLHESEKEIVERRRKTIAKKEYLASRFLIKTFIAQHLDIPYPLLQLCFDEKSAKLKAIYKGKSLALSISLAHSKGIIFFAITHSKTSIGVDIEYQNPHRDSQALIKAYFHHDEVKILPNISKKLFYQFWTLKESLAKINATSVLAVLKQNTEQQLAPYNYITGHYKHFTFAVIQSKPAEKFCISLINNERALQLKDE